MSAPINFSPLIYAAVPLGMPRENTRTRAIFQPPRRRYCPPPALFSSPPRALQISRPRVDFSHPHTPRKGTYFQNTLHVRSHAPASDSTLRFNFCVGLTSFLLTTFLSLSLIEYVLINHATLIRAAVDFLNELRMRWFFARCVYFTKKDYR